MSLTFASPIASKQGKCGESCPSHNSKRRNILRVSSAKYLRIFPEVSLPGNRDFAHEGKLCVPSNIRFLLLSKCA